MQTELPQFFMHKIICKFTLAKDQGGKFTAWTLFYFWHGQKQLFLTTQLPTLKQNTKAISFRAIKHISRPFLCCPSRFSFKWSSSFLIAVAIISPEFFHLFPALLSPNVSLFLKWHFPPVPTLLLMIIINKLCIPKIRLSPEQRTFWR